MLAPPRLGLDPSAPAGGGLPPSSHASPRRTLAPAGDQPAWYGRDGQVQHAARSGVAGAHPRLCLHRPARARAPAVPRIRGCTRAQRRPCSRAPPTSRRYGSGLGKCTRGDAETKQTGQMAAPAPRVARLTRACVRASGARECVCNPYSCLRGAHRGPLPHVRLCLTHPC